MMKKFALVLPLLFAVILPASLRAALVGEPAESVTVQAWLKGQPVQVKPGTNVFLIEIWKSTGVASRAAITNLNRLQARYRTNGLVVFGVSDEPAEVLTNFLQHEGSNIEYSVAADQHRATSMAFMEPARQIAVPYAFLVGTNGVLLWHGHVFQGLDEAVAQVFSGSFDLEHSEKMDMANRQMQQYLLLSRRGDARTRAAGLVLLGIRTNDVPLLCDMAFNICTAPGLKGRDFALASLALSQAEKLVPSNSPGVSIYRAVWLFQGGKRDKGLALASQALAAASNPMEKKKIQNILDTMQAWIEIIKERDQTNQVKNAQAPGPAGGSDQTHTRPADDPAPMAIQAEAGTGSGTNDLARPKP
jgi:hypothetical protein